MCCSQHIKYKISPQLDHHSHQSSLIQQSFLLIADQLTPLAHFWSSYYPFVPCKNVSFLRNLHVAARHGQTPTITALISSDKIHGYQTMHQGQQKCMQTFSGKRGWIFETKQGWHVT